jgi:hypothetical protein
VIENLWLPNFFATELGDKFFLIIVWKTIGCFSCLINNASTSTVDLATENILVSTQFFGAMLENFGHQNLVATFSSLQFQWLLRNFQLLDG